MKGFPLSIILELSCEDCLDIFGIGSEDEALTCESQFNRPRDPRGQFGEQKCPKVRVPVLRRIHEAFIGNVDACTN